MKNSYMGSPLGPSASGLISLFSSGCPSVKPTANSSLGNTRLYRSKPSCSWLKLCWVSMCCGHFNSSAYTKLLKREVAKKGRSILFMDNHRQCISVITWANIRAVCSLPSEIHESHRNGRLSIPLIHDPYAL